MKFFSVERNEVKDSFYQTFEGAANAVQKSLDYWASEGGVVTDPLVREEPGNGLYVWCRVNTARGQITYRIWCELMNK